MPIPSGVDKKKSKVYIQKTGGDYLQILPESFCESEIISDSMWPVSSHALKQYSNSIEERIAPFAGATATKAGKIGTVPRAETGDRNSFLRGDGRWIQINTSDDKVKSTLKREKKFYLVGTEIADTNTGGVSFDPDVFVSEGHGELHATTIIGNLVGNVTGNLDGIATRAEKDVDGNVFGTTYVKNAQLANYSTTGHKHTSADINALNGYSKGNSTAAIAGSDTLNQALGKLEKRMDLAATLNSPSFTGTPTTPNLTSGSSNSQIANKKYVDDKVSSLVNGAGAALDTLSELANALGNDANFATTVTNKFNTKLDKNSANYIKSISISDNTTGSGQILKLQRGDDTTLTLNIKDTIIQPATTAPKAPASTAVVGTSVKYAREDHVHPLQTSISGNASTATTAEKAGYLTTARKLRTNLAATADATFDGKTDQLNIPVTGVLPVANGGTGASNLNGLVQTGNVNQTIGGTKTFSNTITGSITGNAGTANVAKKTTGTPEGTSWVAGATSGKALVNSTATGYGAILNASTKNYKVAMSTYPSNTDLVYLYSVTNANVSSGTNTVAKSMTWDAGTGTLTTATFKGNLEGTATACSGNAATASKLGTATVGGTANPIYLNAGTATAITASVGSTSKPVYLNGGTISACSATVGSGTKPVYMNAGAITAFSGNVGANAKPMYMASGTLTASTANVGGNATPIYMASGTLTASTANVGNATKPIYMANGALTASGSTVGGKTKPVYLASGTVTASDATVGAKTKPVYMNAGTISATDATVGTNTKFMYMSSGTLTASTANVGNASTPVYVAGGTLTACSGISAAKDGAGNQIDTTYLKLSGGTVTGTLNLTKTTDAQGTGTAEPALRLGALSGAHLEFDGNEIMAKASANTVGTLYINSDGGLVQIGSGGLKVTGTITGNLNGNVTGNVSGSAGSCTGNAATATTASKLGTATVGSGTKPIYLNAGTATASSSTVGDASTPVYLSSGTITKCTGVATNKVYKGATSSAAGVVGLVPAASAAQYKNYFRADGTWQDINFTDTVAMGSTETAINLSKGCVFTKTISANTTFTITGVPSGKSGIFNLVLTNGGSKTVVWPSSVKWAERTPPTLTSSGKDLLTFLTPDGGSTWFGMAAVIGAA